MVMLFTSDPLPGQFSFALLQIALTAPVNAFVAARSALVVSSSRCLTVLGIPQALMARQLHRLLIHL
jgi:hypothetical protein